MANGQSASDIISDAKEARQHLGDLEFQLQEEIDEIDFKVFQEDRELTDDERNERRELRASQVEVRDAFVVLTYVTARRLDQSEEVGRLHQKMKEINNGLKDDLERLRQIERYAETAAKVADGIAKITEKVAAVLV